VVATGAEAEDTETQVIYRYDDNQTAVEYPEVALTEYYCTDSDGRLTWTHDEPCTSLPPRGVVVDSYSEDEERLLLSRTYLSESGEYEPRTSYEYDGFGNLILVDLPSAEKVAYQYDALGRRVARIDDAHGYPVTTAWLYADGPRPIAEFNDSDGLRAAFVYAEDPTLPIAVLRDGEVFGVIGDPDGTPIMMVDSSGVLVARDEAQPFLSMADPMVDMDFSIPDAGTSFFTDIIRVMSGGLLDQAQAEAVARAAYIGFLFSPLGLVIDAYQFGSAFIEGNWATALRYAGATALGIVGGMAIIRTAGAIRGTAAFGRAASVARRLTNRLGITPNVARLGQRPIYLPDAPSVRPGNAAVPLGACFVAGTLIETEAEATPIEDIEVGDLVWSRDEETGEMGLRHVVETFIRASQLVELEVETENGIELIETTPEHPFWVEDFGWVAAGQLLPGDELFTSRGGWARVANATWAEAEAEVYNFEVADWNSYFVGEAGVWVHNAACALPNSHVGSAARQGREFRQDWLQLHEFDVLQPRHIRGWLKNERRMIDQGRLAGARNPPGYVMAHGMNTPARHGFDYSNATLSLETLNKLEERLRRRLRLP